MNFHSVEFLVFLAVVLPTFWLLSNRRSTRSLLLLAGSYVFYGAYEAWYLGLLVFSTFLDYWCGGRIHAARGRGDMRAARRFLLASLVGNLGLLGFFKYTDWLVESLQLACDALGLGVELWDARTRLLPPELLDSATLRIIVPVGISFYTFQTLSYTIDVYRGRLPPARSFRDFALFVAFFPQLVAGPIVRALDFLPQLELRPRFDRARLHEGLWRMGIGLLKKVAIADVVGGGLVDVVYDQPGNYTALVHLLALYGFAFQIYFDFSGYSDIAIGTAKLLGFDLTENFETPYRSRSIREFWRRWHISLSSWVRDYIYFPLGGSRGGELRVSRNLLITMLVIGIWHGASVLWVIYGLLQGGSMILERFLERRRGGREFATTPARSLFAWALTFHFIVFSCLFIRAGSLGQIGELVGAFGATGVADVDPWALAALAGGALTHFWPRAVSEL
ncbi:MAG TPA: MBOAT family O-acyltransferase, partial [Planctomycetota bacterium]|nr:MBOAT family O-acyltransferase [Planctomycetota bacterium]